MTDLEMFRKMLEGAGIRHTVGNSDEEFVVIIYEKDDDLVNMYFYFNNSGKLAWIY